MSSSRDITDDGVHPEWTDLNASQRDILIATSDVSEGMTPYGTAIKETIEDYYGENVNHARVYQQLDALVEAGLIEKGTLDKRTNSYELTDSAENLIGAQALTLQEVAHGDD